MVDERPGAFLPPHQCPKIPVSWLPGSRGLVRSQAGGWMSSDPLGQEGAAAPLEESQLSGSSPLADRTECSWAEVNRSALTRAVSHCCRLHLVSLGHSVWTWTASAPWGRGAWKASQRPELILSLLLRD